MNEPVFADTLCWAALTDTHDAFHARAAELDQSVSGRPLTTTDEVLTEFLTYFAWDPWLRGRAAITVHEILEQGRAHVVPQTRGTFLAGFELYESRPDKAYSLTDCISMETMRRTGIREVLTNDRHFEQEGFHALFRQP